jgi:hypothetical protein
MKYLVGLLAAVLLAVHPVAAKDQLLINGNFTRISTNASGTNVPGVNFDMMIGNGKARITLTCTNVSPATNFQFVVGDVSQATFAGNVRRNANVFFQNFESKERAFLFPLTFDPRDQVLTITDGHTNLLRLTIGTSNQSTNVRYLESADLAVVSGGGSAEARYDQTKADLRSFKVTLKGVSSGTYDVFVDGIHRGSIPIPNGSKGLIHFKYPYGNNDVPLTFDPRGKSVQVVRQGAVRFSGFLRTPLIFSPAP